MTASPTPVLPARGTGADPGHGGLPAGRQVMVEIEGTTLTPQDREFLRRNQIRAVCLFSKNLSTQAQSADLVRDLVDAMGPSSIVAIDQEGGSVVRTRFLPHPPSAMCLGAAGDAALARQVGAATARGLRGIGVNWNFAPVVDLCADPHSAVVAARSFGESPEAVTRLARAWMEGSQAEGVAACIKHFPGHGPTHVDSHLRLPRVDLSWAALEATHLRPFQQLADIAPAMMTAHILYPGIDAARPATLSQRWLRDTLRAAWGYAGVVITDSLHMGAIREQFGSERAAVMALQAGADMVAALGPREQQQATVDALQQAGLRGDLDLAQARRACARVDALAARWPAGPVDGVPAQQQDDERLMRGAWAQGLTALDGARPPPAGARLGVRFVRSAAGDGVSEAGPSVARLEQLFGGFADVRWHDRRPSTANDAGAAPGDDGRFEILVTATRSRAPAAASGQRTDLHIALWNPFQVHDVAAPAVVTWGHAEPALQAVQQWLAGELAAPGRPPVSLRRAPP